MPTYDYHCKTCGRNFEWFQSISADRLSHCPENICQEEIKGHGEVERKISRGAGVIFSGSGFYLTDYARSGSKEPESPSPAKESSSKESSSKESPAPLPKDSSKGDSSKGTSSPNAASGGGTASPSPDATK